MASRKKIEAPSVWKCALCSNKVTIHIALDYPPACQSGKHKSKIIDMAYAESSS